MNPAIRNILAVIAGALLGMVINGGIVSVSGMFIPPPEGVDPNDLESIKANMHLFEAKHFIMPFIAHAVGTFVGALLTAMLAASRKLTFALIIGLFFLLGGIAASLMIPAPLWFGISDLLIAYIPMAFLGGKLGQRLVPAKS